MIPETERGNSRYGEDELSLVDIARFLSRNGKFLVLTTVGLSVITISLSLSMAQQYQKQLALSVRPYLEPVSAQLDPLSDLLAMDAGLARGLAVESLQKLQLERTTANVQDDGISRQIQLTLQSPDSSSLNGAGQKIVNQLEADFGETLGKTLQTRLASINIELNRNKQVLAQLEQQISRLSPSDTGRREALEAQRASVVTNTTRLEFDKQYLEQLQKKPADFASKVISVQIINESEVRQTRSPKALVVLAAITSFLVAVLATILRAQVAHLKNELSKQKLDGNTDV